MEKFYYAGTLETKNIRHYLVPRFPYKILYTIKEELVIILAFAHQHREPNYWIDRI
ncbi:hypothetical protein ACFL2K_04275 [Candidatus Margulisiibacteriota bacterium]